MTGLHRTPLTTSDKIELAIKAILGQEYGRITALSQEYEVSRTTVYSAREAATGALEAHFEKPAEDDVVYRGFHGRCLVGQANPGWQTLE